MTPERWQQLDELFRTAVEVPIAERAAFLDSRCTGDEELRRDIEGLLNQDARGDDPVEAAVRRQLQETAEEPVKAAIGRRFGPYRVTELIEESAMSAVYRATRDDEEYLKDVAVKIAKGALVAPGIAERFRRERQILALLDHPGIARLLDGGTTEEGLPYFVMEYVDGLPVNEYCIRHKLPGAERIRLFRRICEVVQYAHRCLVIHRDLKPANILVTNDGSPKLLDFGIAKLLAPDALFGAGPLTRPNVRFFTPDYASPEQVRGQPITTATDVYSLGAVLYELLTGQRVHSFRNQSGTEIDRAVCETDPPLPGLVASERIPRDVETIVVKALRKEPNRRYGSVEQFSEDLRRWDEGLPVLARPDTIRYRARKFFRRHALVTTAAALLFLTLACGIVVTTYQAHRAQRRFDELRKLANTFLFEFHDQIRDLPGSTAAREMVVRTALEYLDRLAADAGGDRSLVLELAAAYERVGDAQGYPHLPNLGRTDEALRSYRKALEARKRCLRGGREPEYLRPLCDSYYKLGDVLAHVGDSNGAIANFEEGVRIAEELSDQRLLGNGYLRMGDVRIRSADPKGALASYQAAAGAHGRWARSMPPERASRTLATVRLRVGDALQELGWLQNCRLEYQHALDALGGLPKDELSRPAAQRQLMIVYHSLGNVAGNPFYLNLGDSVAAATYYQRALELAKSLQEADAKNMQARADVALSLWKLGAVLRDRHPRQAIPHLKQAVSIVTDLAAMSNANTEHLRNQAFYLLTLGQSLRLAGDGRSAIVPLQRALAIQRRISEKDRKRSQFLHDIPITLDALGDTHRDLGDRAAAVLDYCEACSIAESLVRLNPIDLTCGRELAECRKRLSALGSQPCASSRD